MQRQSTRPDVGELQNEMCDGGGGKAAQASKLVFACSGTTGARCRAIRDFRRCSRHTTSFDVSSGRIMSSGPGARGEEVAGGQTAMDGAERAQNGL